MWITDEEAAMLLADIQAHIFRYVPPMPFEWEALYLPAPICLYTFEELAMHRNAGNGQAPEETMTGLSAHQAARYRGYLCGGDWPNRGATGLPSDALATTRLPYSGQGILDRLTEICREAAMPGAIASPRPGFLCEVCFDAPVLRERPAPWGGVMGDA